MTDKPKKLTVKRTVLQIIKENEALKDALRDSKEYILRLAYRRLINGKAAVKEVELEAFIKRLEELLK